MTQFQEGSSPYRLNADGTSISTDGGNSFTTLLPDTPLPDGPGASYYGDGGNATLARDPMNGNIFLATTSDIGGHYHPDIQVFESTDGGLYDGVSATSTDLSLYFSGVNGYKQFGAL